MTPWWPHLTILTPSWPHLTPSWPHLTILTPSWLHLQAFFPTVLADRNYCHCWISFNEEWSSETWPLFQVALLCHMIQELHRSLSLYHSITLPYISVSSLFCCFFPPQFEEKPRKTTLLTTVSTWTLRNDFWELLVTQCFQNVFYLLTGLVPSRSPSFWRPGPASVLKSHIFLLNSLFCHKITHFAKTASHPKTETFKITLLWSFCHV